jgi:hypothetical protein
LLAGAVCTLAVFVLRLSSVLALHGLIPTSGVEGAGSYGIFQACVGQATYHDFSTAPNIAVFNFLFYEFYGLAVRLFAPCDAGTPLAGRLLTVVFVAVLAAAIFAARDERLPRAEAGVIALGAFSFFVGWWAFALRPDAGAAAFLALCVIALLSYLSAPGLPKLLGVAFFLCCAWGFKQPYAVAGPVLLWFILRQDRRHALIFCAVLLAAIGIPFLAYGARPYFLHTVYAEATAPLYADIAVGSLTSFLVKGLPILVPAMLAIAACRGPDQARNFLLALLAFSFFVALATAGKVGAADNYFLPTFVVAAILCVRCLPRCAPPVRRAGLAASAAISIALAIAILSGLRGAVSVASHAPIYRDMATQVNAMPAPKLVWHEAVALPWFGKDVETRILWDREGDALVPGAFDPRRRVAEGRYRTVVIPAYEEKRFDLSHYRLVKATDDMRFFERRP